MFTTVKSDDHALHFPEGELAGGKLVRPYECPERWTYISDALLAEGHSKFVTPEPVSRKLLEQVHSVEFLRFLEDAWAEWKTAGFDGDAIPTVFPARRMRQKAPEFIDGKLGYFAMAVETAITRGSWTAALSSASCAVTAQSLVSTGNSEVFALCRPPGHHAASDLYGGYCFLNNAALAATGFLTDGASRVAILDVDFHHGNGTQDIFYQRDDVLFLSLHGDPVHAFPHFLGYSDERGAGKGEGYNKNYPLAPGTPYAEWQIALDDACKSISEYAPDVLVVSLGVDTYEKDPISFFKLTNDDFTRYGEKLGRLGIPSLFVMEGGYAVEEIGVNTVNVLNGFSATV